MKIIKRDGRAVDYNRDKIAIAIQKANKEVLPKERATKEEIKEIIKYIESLGKKRMLVEDIQDIIEEKLMEIQKYKLAKRYIVYRYTRALVRKQNTTDESILGLIRNDNKNEDTLTKEKNGNTMLASIQRNYMAGEVSRDLTKRLLLPEKIVKADEEGILHFHDADYFIQPIFNSCLINISDMLDNGTVMNGKKIKTPKTFQTACMVLTQIIAATTSNQYGGQSIDLIHLGKYLKKSHDKLKKEMEEKYKEKIPNDIIESVVQDRLKEELKLGVKTIKYQINTLMIINGRSPYVTLFLHLEKDDPYIKENAMIIEEILKQRGGGVKNEEGIKVPSTFPKLVYVVDEFNNLTGGKYDYLTKLAIECSAKSECPYYISAKKMREYYSGNVFSPMGELNLLPQWKDNQGNYKFEGRFNQGVVSINLPQIGIIADGDDKKFWQELDERLELCKEALMCRHYALLGTTSDISPIHWQYGAIARLKKGEKINELLYNGYSTISLGYIGIYEVTKLMVGESHITEKGHDFAKKLMKYLRQTTEKWKKETNIGFVLYSTPSKKLGYRFAKIDKEKFGIIKDVTDKGYYTNSYYVDPKEKINVYDKISFESEFQKISSGGAISYIEIPNIEKYQEEAENAIKFAYDNIHYIKFNNR